MRRAADLVTVTAGARRIGLHPSTLRRWIFEGRIPSFGVPPRKRKVDIGDLDALAASWRCPRCAFSGASPGALAGHLRALHPKGTPTPQAGPRVDGRPLSARPGASYGKGPPPAWTCPGQSCGKAFGTAGDLARHLVTVHGLALAARGLAGRPAMGRPPSARPASRPERIRPPMKPAPPKRPAKTPACCWSCAASPVTPGEACWSCGAIV